jgi:hypothetical protein
MSFGGDRRAGNGIEMKPRQPTTTGLGMRELLRADTTQ